MYKIFAYILAAGVGIICVWSAAKKELIEVKRKESDIRYIFFLILLFCVFLFSRLYMLNVLPVGIHVDELSMAYDAQSIAEYGMDRNGIRYPAYLQNFGGGQSSLYAYLTALLLEFFPYSIRLIRIPAVFCASLAFFASFFLVDELLENKKWSLLGPLFVTITPFFMNTERFGLDCNLFLSLSTVSLWGIIRAIKHGKVQNYIFGGIAMGATLYTYAMSYIVLPLFLVFAMAYLIYIRKFEWKKILAFAIPLFALALPLQCHLDKHFVC